MKPKVSRRCLAVCCLLLSGSLAVLFACRHQEAEKSGPEAPAEPTRVTVEQVRQWMAEGQPPVFLDSRSSYAWDSATTKVPGAIRVPPDDVQPYLSKIPRDRKIVVYCT